VRRRAGERRAACVTVIPGIAATVGVVAGKRKVRVNEITRLIPRWSFLSQRVLMVGARSDFSGRRSGGGVAIVQAR
jgi:hypothetical protein